MPDTKDRIDKELMRLCGEKTYQGYNSKGSPNSALPFGGSTHVHEKKTTNMQQKGPAKSNLLEEVANPLIEGKKFERGRSVWVKIQSFPWWPGIVKVITDVPEKQREMRIGSWLLKTDL